jgi:hypothetical protein
VRAKIDTKVVAKKDVEIIVKTGAGKLGTLLISKLSVEWLPKASRFLIFGKSQDLVKTKAIRPGRRTSLQIRMLTIPRESVLEIESDLEMCGITGPLLSPDLEALGRDLCRKCRIWS